MYLIADTHINQYVGNHVDFFQMLTLLAENRQDIVFLGDIFDLWIALPRYEQTIHHQFRHWCQRQKNYRKIIFVEGNHEYFLTSEHPGDFTHCTEDGFIDRPNGYLFCHGDQINQMDKNYLRFRWLVKNRISKFILRFFPNGPKIVEKIKHNLKKTNQNFRTGLPYEQIHYFALKHSAEREIQIFVGHFHKEYTFNTLNNSHLHVIPAWKDGGLIAHFDENEKKLTHIHWQTLKSGI